MFFLKEIPEEIQKMMEIVNPYIERCCLKEDAPQEIKDLYKKICEMTIYLDQ